MRALILVHRWLGIPLCLLFAMWFASGIVMHFVPFPALTEAERIEGMGSIDLSQVLRSPYEAVNASGITEPVSVRLLQRVDGPVYLVTDPVRIAALHAADLSDAAVRPDELALTIAVDHARRRKLSATQAALVGREAYDQWTVSGSLDRHRPLYHVAFNDPSGTELYVSSKTGEVVRDTSSFERGWNYFGSVAHWIYPTVLRSHPAVWNNTVWWLSLAALIAALAGSILGIVRASISGGGMASPYQGWHKWHHVLGLACMSFVLTWIFSGWLSMDSGRLFSSGGPASREVAIAASGMGRDGSPEKSWRPVSTVKEVEWFSFNGNPYRRERTGVDTQHLFRVSWTESAITPRQFLGPQEVGDLVGRLASDCKAPAIVAADDNYPIASSMPHAPVYRSVCGDIWFHIDAASGALLERLDSSRRAYRWLYGALHTMDFPVLAAHPLVRSTLIVVLCGLGFIFSITAIVIGWRRVTPDRSTRRTS